jgi:hypothetical protein
MKNFFIMQIINTQTYLNEKPPYYILLSIIMICYFIASLWFKWFHLSLDVGLEITIFTELHDYVYFRARNK